MKNIRTVISALLCCTLIWGCKPVRNFTKSEISIIPQVKEMTLGESSFKFDKKTKLVVENADQEIIAHQFAGLFEKASGWKLPVILGAKVASNQVFFKTIEMKDSEAYSLVVMKNRIEIKASKPAGFFYAMQTLRQLLPTEIESRQIEKNTQWIVPVMTITDSPAFKWRGMMLDVSRHFFPKEDVFRLIDYLALHKINTLQLHLVDQQGWRIEIKKYPKLTEVGAWRVDRGNASWNSTFKQQPGEKATYGGFYTQEDIKEMVAYAQKHFITIVPEIEMPAHVTSALAAYPQFSCSQKPTTVLPGGFWPISDLYCAGNDSTFEFLQDVLSEVIELFPSKYIHIGGDEANRSEWEKCPKCQKRVHDEGLKNTAELQGYFIKRIEKFIHSKGRVLIGWDEILEGDLPKSATVMSWRGFEGGIDASKKGHDVVMTPGAYCYFDSYQAPMAAEPTAMGGYLPLKKVYSFNPVPAQLNASEASHIIGAQANLWTEYISDWKQVEYMTFPRIAALSEVLWSAKETQNWDDFSRRMQILMNRYDQMKINYAKSAFQVTIHPAFDTTVNKLKVTLEREFSNVDIHYTTDGSEPTVLSPIYSKPLLLDKSTTVKAATFSDKVLNMKRVSENFDLNLATGKPVKYLIPYNEGFKGRGKITLVNGIRGSIHYNDEEWQGWNSNDMEVVVDLQKTTEIHNISIGALQDIGTWMFMPSKVDFFISTDGVKFQKVGEVQNDIDPLSFEKQVKDFSLTFPSVKANFVKVLAHNLGKIPKGHPLEGDAAWLFIDEISVR
jgi:hexosaminidase